MRSALLIVCLVCLAGCSSQAPEPKVIKEADEPLKVHPLTQDKDFIQDQKTAKAIEEAKKKQSPAAAPATKPVEPEILGEYKLVLNPDQRQQIEAMIKKLEADSAAGDKQAIAALPMAKAAQEAAMNMVVRLGKSGTYTANLGGGETTGTFTRSEKGVILRPSVPNKDPNDPPDVEFGWDKAKKQLTVDFQGRIMVFEKTK